MGFLKGFLDALFGRFPDADRIADEADNLKRPLPNEESDLALHVDACTRRYANLWDGLKHALRAQAAILATQRLLVICILLLLYVEFKAGASGELLGLFLSGSVS